MADFTDEILAARADAADVLIDRGRLTRDADGNDDATLDPDTLALAGGDDSTGLWTGYCLVTPTSTREETVAPADKATGVLYRALLPADAPLPVVDDVLTLSRSLDPTLVGVPLRVRVARSSSALVFRELLVERVPT